MSSASIWTAGYAPAPYPPMSGDQAADVCIVGAGIAGLTTAYFLTRAGKTVIVLDREDVGGGETSRTSAHLVNVLDYRFSELTRLHSVEKIRSVAESHNQAIDTIESIARRENISCGFVRVPGFLTLAEDDEPSTLNDELEAAKAVGVAVEAVNSVPLLRVAPRPALRFPNQAQFHPLLYLHGLARAVCGAGGRIHGCSNVKQVKGGEPCEVELENGSVVRARDVVLAASAPLNLLALHTKQAAYRTFVAAFTCRQPQENALVWDTADPFHYVRLHQTENGTVLLAGGEDYKTGHDEGHESAIANLTEWTNRHFDVAPEPEVSWSGQVLEPVDKLAFIGRNPGDQHVYVVTGTSGNGLTYGTIAGLLLTDLIERRENTWAAVYEPGRIPLAATARFLSENADVAAQYADWITPGDQPSADNLAPGTGAIVRKGASKLAIFRDLQGQLHHFSAVCPHLGCIVAWNTNEQSWDCPCHGSRFSPQGAVLNGPAISGLEKADD